MTRDAHHPSDEPVVVPTEPITERETGPTAVDVTWDGVTHHLALDAAAADALDRDLAPFLAVARPVSADQRGSAPVRPPPG